MVSIIIVTSIALIIFFALIYTMYEVPENSIKELIYKNRIYYLYEFEGIKHIFSKKIIKKRKEYLFFGKKRKVIILKDKLISSNNEKEINLFLEKQ